jgi:hypothetical protein
MGTNWHELRDLGNERARAAIADAQRAHRATRMTHTARTAHTAPAGHPLHRVWLALRELLPLSPRGDARRIAQVAGSADRRRVPALLSAAR